jgi:hypothetical protein
MRRLVTWASLILIHAFATAAEAAPIQDDFNDGNDNGWTRFNPLSFVGANTTFTFPNGAYRISSEASPDPAALGPARGASLRLDQTYSDFTASVDLVDLDLTPADTDLGLLARVREPAIGTLDGYAFTYDVGGGVLSLIRITDEVDTLLDSRPFFLNLSLRYRLTLSGSGPDLTATLEEVDNLGLILAVLTAQDTTYTEGNIGLLVYDDSASGRESTSGTFDNFTATVPEPSTSLLAALALGTCALRPHRRAAAAGLRTR